MAINDTDLKTAKETQYALNNTKYIDSNKTEFWFFSDIAEIYKDFLNKKRLIYTDTFHTNLQHSVFNKIPEYYDIFPRPIHVKSIHTSELSKTDSKDIIYKEDQQITRVGCEFFFQKFDEATMTQAYFLFPQASVMDLTHLSDGISIYHKANKIKNVTSIFVAMIANKTIDFNKDKTFNQIWDTLWTTLFNTKDLHDLKTQYNIVNAPTTHIAPNYWMYIHYMLQDCINYLKNGHDMLYTEDILEQCHDSAAIQRHMIERHTEHSPEYFLTKTDFRETVLKIEDARKDFWLCYYPRTLQR